MRNWAWKTIFVGVCMVVITGCIGTGDPSLGKLENFGQFSGPLDLRSVKSSPGKDKVFSLLEDFTYIDPKGEKWTARKGFQTDGASIPRVFWSLVGHPYGGDYLEAAVIHDWYCDKKTKPWKDVHKIFYYACIAAGVTEEKAAQLYLAVRGFGPRWGSDESKCYPACHASRPVRTSKTQDAPTFALPFTETEARRVLEWVAANRPTLDEIDAYVDKNFPRPTPGHSSSPF